MITKQKIADTINLVLQKSRKALDDIPALLVVCGSINRPGLSSTLTTAKIITRLNEAGISSGVNTDGTPNKLNKLIRIIVEEIYDDITKNGKVRIAFPPGSISAIGTGANAGGPMEVIVKNIQALAGNGFLN